MALKSVFLVCRLHHPLLPPGLVIPVMMAGPNVHRAVIDSVANGHFARLRVQPVARPIARLTPISTSLMLPDAGQRVESNSHLYRAPSI